MGLIYDNRNVTGHVYHGVLRIMNRNEDMQTANPLANATKNNHYRDFWNVLNMITVNGNAGMISTQNEILIVLQAAGTNIYDTYGIYEKK